MSIDFDTFTIPVHPARREPAVGAEPVRGSTEGGR